MPDFGVTRAILKGVKKAKTVPRGTKELAAEQAAAAKAGQIENEAMAGSSQTIAEGGEQTQALQDVIAEQAAEGAQQQTPPPGTARGAQAPQKAATPPARPPQQPGAPPPGGPGRAPTVDAEASRLSALELGDFDLTAPEQINFDRMTTTSDVSAVIADVSRRNAPLISRAKRGVIANEQLRALANDLNLSEEVIRPVLIRESGGVLNPETILASRQVLAASADRIMTLAKKIRDGNATDMEKVQFRRQLMFHDDYQVAFQGARAETGRALNAFSIPVGVELDPQRVAEMRRSIDNMNDNNTSELARMATEMESVGQLGRFVRASTRSRTTGVLREVFVNSILSGPKTQLVNTIGNTLFSVMNTIEYGVAAQVGKLLPGAAHVEVGEASAMLYGQLSGWRDAMRYAKLAFKHGETTDSVTKFGTHQPHAISSRNLFPTGAPPSVAAVVDLVGNVIRFPTERMMAPTDEFFKSMAYRGDLARQAFLEANQRVAGKELKPNQIADFVQQYMENPGAAARRKAEQYAKYVTFQQELGVTGRRAQLLVNSTRGGFIIAPFVRTPVNIFKAGLLERSPLAIFSETFWQAMKKGGPERDLAVARVSMGTLTVGAVAAATTAGYITGGGPQDAGARQALLATGWQPYSIRYEDPITGETKYQSYARAEPLAYVIGATADLVEIRAWMNADDPLSTDEENMNRAIAAITAAVANNTMSKTFLSNIADFSSALDDPARYMEDFVTRTGQAFIPYSSFRRQITQIQDPIVREAWTYTDKLRSTAGLAGYSEGLPPKRDIFGEEVRHRGGELMGSLSPFPDSIDKGDEVANEIVSVMQQTGSVPVTMPSRKIEGMKLSTMEYEQLVRFARKDPNFAGQTFRERLRDLIGSSTYLLATPDMKAVLMRQVREDADAIGRQTLERDNPEFASRLALHRLKKAELLTGESP